jgi:DNA repair protein RadC
MTPPTLCYVSDGEPIVPGAEADAVVGFWNQHSTVPNFDLNIEHALVLLLDAERRPIGTLTMAGRFNTVEIYAYQIVEGAQALQAKSMIFLHSHPPDMPVAPSWGDRSFTARLVPYARGFNVQLLDHVIVGTKTVGMSFGAVTIGSGEYFSFEENHMLFFL